MLIDNLFPSPRVPRQWRAALMASVAVVALVAAGCTTDPQATTRGALESLTQTPSPFNVLSTMVEVEADEPVRVDVTAVSGSHAVTVPRTSESSTSHEIPVVGLRANQTYDIEVDLISAGDANVGSGSIVFETGRLPQFIPEMTFETPGDGQAEGLTFVEITPSAREGYEEGEDPLEVRHVVALDSQGEVVWYYSHTGAINDVRVTDRGTILSVFFPFGIRETDLLGNVVGNWGTAPDLMPWQDYTPEQLAGFDAISAGNKGDMEAIDITADWVDIRSFHHEAFPMPNGNILGLGSTLHEPTPEQRRELCPGDPQEFWVISDVIVEFTPSGEVVKTWDLWDVIDVMETPGEEMCEVRSNIATEIERDWGHANSAVYDPVRDAIIVSTRHTSQIVAMPYGTEDGPQDELLWTIGTDGTIPLDGDVPRYQHAVEVEDDGSLIFYDNGNGREGTAPGTDNPPYSRAVVYEVDDTSDDPADWTATQRWEHRVDETPGRPVFAAFLGDADRLDNGNVLIDHGGIPNPAPAEGDHNRCMIIEVVPTDDGGEVISDLRIGSAERPVTCYRTDRVPTMYTGPDWE